MIEARSYARAGLLGNPSDGYFGKTISISVRNFGAHVSLYESPELCIEPGINDTNVYRNIYELADSVNLLGYYGGIRLIKAAIKTFWEYTQNQSIRLNNRNFTIRFHSSIPRQIGLAGSSAIVTATLRALQEFYEVDIPLEVFPNIVLSAEKDELGINAGLQDRVIQAYEGCVYMDFEKSIMDAQGHGNYERIDPALLPNLYIAYKTDLGKVSGTVLNDIRTRWEKQDPVVIENLQRIAEIAAEGAKAIRKKNLKKLSALINENFDCRAKIMNISDDNWQLVNTARKCGASAKFTGSGGSIIGTYENDRMLTNLIVELKKINARVIKPYVY